MRKLDDIDAAILHELWTDARLTNLELSEKIGLSASACLRRVAALEREGIIKGYRVILDPAAMGRSFVAYVAVGLSEHSKAAQLGFERAMATADEVAEVHNIAGTFEYLLRVEASDMDHYKRFHTEILGTVEHVASITSHIVMGISKDTRA